MMTKEFWIEQLGESWAMKLKPLLKSDYMEKLLNKLMFDYAWHPMYPPNKKDIFKAFRLCPWDQVRIVVICTEPGRMVGWEGIPFADSNSVHQNPSATQIRNCLEKEYGLSGLDFDFSFEAWARQGILLLNRSLTCSAEEPRSHREAWKQFFGSILYLFEKEKHGTIFLLWGKEAQKYSELLSVNHHVFSWEHPMKASSQFRAWSCPNFKQIDNLIKTAYEESNSIRWL